MGLERRSCVPFCYRSSLVRTNCFSILNSLSRELIVGFLSSVVNDSALCYSEYQDMAPCSLEHSLTLEILNSVID